MNEVKLKRTLRSMKQQEIRLFHKELHKTPLVYETFFGGSKPHYPYSLLSKMDRGAFQLVLEEYWGEVLYSYFKSRGIEKDLSRDPRLLKVLGLPLGATVDMIKKRFRQLAHRFHPDHGGDVQAFIEIQNAYEQLKND